MIEDNCWMCGKEMTEDDDRCLRSRRFIHNLAELLDEEHCLDAEHLALRLHKDTRCGICCNAIADEVILAGYCEGVDSGCAPIVLKFPFPIEKFEEAVDVADDDGCALWDATHGCEDCGLDGAINPNCSTCHGEGVVI